MDTNKEFKVGDGATIFGWSDQHAATIISISKSKRAVIIQEDTATLLNGYNSGQPDALIMVSGGFAGHTTGTQRWEFKPNPQGSQHRVSLRKNGKWIISGTKTPVILGVRNHYYDFNF